MATYDSKVTNSSSETVEAIDGYVASPKTASVGYEQDLTLLSFKDRNGKTSSSLASGESATLVRTRDTANMMFSKTNGYFTPVYQTSVSYDALAETSSDTTIPSDAFDRMKLAAKFYQNITANPTSNLADSFHEALNNAGNDQDTYMTNWFAATQNYGKVKWSDYYIPASSWMNKFASVWVAKNDLFDGDDIPAAYYVYTSTASDYCTSLGTIVVTKNSSATANDLTDTGVGYKFTYQVEKGDHVALTFSHGALADTSGGINLGGTFDYKGKYTTDSSDQSTLWAIFSGTIYGTKVIAIPMTPTDKKNATVAFWEKKGFTKYFSLIMGVLMVAMGIEFVALKGYWVYEKIKSFRAKNKRDPTSQERSEIEKEAQSQVDESNAENEARIRKISNDDSLELPKNESDLGDLRTSVKTSSVTNFEWQSKAQAKFSYESTHSTLEKLARIQNTTATENASSSLREAAEYFKSGDYGNCSTKVTEANVHLDTAIESLKGSLDEQWQRLYRQEVEYNTRASEQAKRYSDDLEKAKNGETEDIAGDEVLPEYDVLR